MEKQTMWAVFGPKGRLHPFTLSPKKWKSIELMEEDCTWYWKELYRAGYRCRKIEVTITKI